VARGAATQQLRHAGVLLEHPGEGGLFLWGALPAGVDVDSVVKDAYRAKHPAGARCHLRGRYGARDPHIRFNVAFSQHPRLSDYLRERLQALAGARDALARAHLARTRRDKGEPA
jgi:DNA-binding transcriptional MocR family regulator